MPFRPGVDDNEELLRLLGLWSDTRVDLDGQLAGVLAEIEDLARSGLNPTRRRRLRILADRLEDLRATAVAMVDALVADTASWLEDPNLASIYAAGASKVPSFVWSNAHQSAVDVIAQDLMGRALGRTSYVDAVSKSWVRRVSREMVGFQATQGQPGQTVARRFVARLRAEFTSKGIVGVTYRDGSVHSFMEYGEMLIRTQSAKAYNVGALNAGRAAGIEYYELFDGADCGLMGHNTEPKANGLVVHWLVAFDWYVSHPNCRRSVNPRPDVNRGNVDSAESVLDPDSVADQANFERVMAENTARTRPRRFRG